jgi:hypothetical protein
MHNKRKAWRKVSFAAAMVSDVDGGRVSVYGEVISVGGSLAKIRVGSRKI